jgi:predicted ATPase
VEQVWGADPPRTADRTLQSYVTRLRKRLGAGALVRVGTAYRLDLPADAVDVVRFQRHLDRGDIDAALAEWTGHPLTGLTVPGLAATVDGLVERWLTAIEADLAVRVETDAATAIGPLTELTSRHPFREGLWALLMTALYRTGRQADALAAYRAARQHLVEHLGVEPGPRLRELESLVLRHDARLAAPADGRRGNLPLRPGRLIGRDEDLKNIDDTLAAYPVVTLVGPGGVGKTRLAVAAARRAAVEDGAWRIDLTEISAAGDVPRAVAGPLGINERPGRTLTESIVAGLRARQTLLVLDNCEDVIDGAAALAQAIAEGCPHVRVLATSRDGLRLGHGHERLIAVAPLAPAGPGVELFNERASAVSAGYDPLAGRRDVEEICRRLDGVPLAIELAAARTTSLAPADLLARLDDHLPVLVGGPRTGAARHRTLRATIGWSYDLLSPPEQSLFQRLSIFAGPFDVAAAEAVGGDAAVDLLGGLVERSMVVVEPGPLGRRFRLLETMRQFAAGHLAAAGHTGLVAERHARWCLDRVTRIHRLLAGPAEVEGVARLDELWPNLRAAFDWACAANDRRLAHRLVRPVVAEVALRNRNEIGDWVERILAITPPDDTELVIFGLAWAAQRYKLSNNPGAYDLLVDRYGEPDSPLVRRARACAHADYAALAEWARPATAELRRGDHDLAEQAEVDLGAALLLRGHFAEGDALVGRLAERYRAQGPPTLLNWCLMLLGLSASGQGEHDRAARLFDEAVSVEIPKRTHGPNRLIEARTLFRRGDRQHGLRILHAYIEELLDTDNMQGACVAAIEFINMMTQIGRLPAAAHILRYVETTGLLDGPTWATQVADAKAQLAEVQTATEVCRDDRQALEYMRRVLR